MNKKLICFLCILLSVILSSCGVIIINNPNTTEPVGTEGNIQTDSAETAVPEEDLFKKAEELLKNMSLSSFNGEKTVIATVDSTFFNGDKSETKLNSDRIARIELTENKLATKMHVKADSVSNLIFELERAKKNSSQYANVLAVPYSMLGTLISKDLIMPLSSIEGLDLNADYFNKSSSVEATFKNNVYAVSGDGCFEPEKTYAIYYNKDLCTKAELGDLQQISKSGAWTLDFYEKCLTDASDKLEGITLQGTSSDTSYATQLLSACGFKYSVIGEDGNRAPNVFSDEYKALTEKLTSINGFKPVKSEKLFSEGKVLFYTDTVANASKYTNSSFSWGILPYPKQSEKSSYGSFIAEDTVVFCIPSNVHDPVACADIIKALCVSSQDYMLDNYIKHNMNYVVRSNEDLNSLYSCLTGANYDFVKMIESAYPTLSTYTTDAFEDIVNKKISFNSFSGKKQKCEEYFKKHLSAS